jgi:hypothetical protein
MLQKLISKCVSRAALEKELEKQKFILFNVGKKKAQMVTYKEFKKWITDNAPSKNDLVDKKLKKTSGRGMFGGVKISAKHLTWFINASIGLFIAYSIWTVPVGLATAKAGIDAVLSGTCNTATNYIWSVMGISNPVCQIYQRILRIVDQALWHQQPEAIAKLVGYIVISLKAPTLALYCKKKATYLLASQILQAANLIEDEEVEILRQQINSTEPLQLTDEQRRIFSDNQPDGVTFEELN